MFLGSHHDELRLREVDVLLLSEMMVLPGMAVALGETNMADDGSEVLIKEAKATKPAWRLMCKRKAVNIKIALDTEP